MLRALSSHASDWLPGNPASGSVNSIAFASTSIASPHCCLAFSHFVFLARVDSLLNSGSNIKLSTGLAEACALMTSTSAIGALFGPLSSPGDWMARGTESLPWPSVFLRGSSSPYWIKALLVMCRISSVPPAPRQSFACLPGGRVTELWHRSVEEWIEAKPNSRPYTPPPVEKVILRSFEVTVRL